MTEVAKKPKSRRNLIAAIVVIIIVIVAALGYYVTLPPAKPPIVGNIKIGFTISLQGTYVVEGHASLNGIITAVRWINSQGGVVIGGKAYNLTIVYYDDLSQASNIVPLYTKLIQDDKADFLLAPYSSGLTAAAAPLSDQYGKIMMSHGGAADSIYQQNYKYVIGVLSPATYYFRPAIDWLKANHPTDKIAVIYADDAFSKTAAVGGSDYAKSLGFQVVSISAYPTTIKDVSPLLTAAKAAGADDIIGGGHFNDGLLLTKQLQEIGWKPKFISLLVAITEPSFQTQLGSAADGVSGPSQWEAAVPYSADTAKSKNLEWFGPSSSDFVTLYKQVSGGANPTYHSGEAGASILVLAKALQTANTQDIATLRQVLGSMDIMTFFGEFKIDSTGKQVGHQMVVIQWQSGTLKVVWPKEASQADLKYPY